MKLSSFPPSRTASGKAPGGTLRGTRPDELAAVAIAEALEARAGHRSGGSRRRDPGLRDAGGGTGHERRADRQPARRAFRSARRPSRVNRFCSSGLQAIAYAAERIMCGSASAIVAGGTESMSLGADGRPQDRAEPDADRPLSGRVSLDRPGRGEPRARSRASRAPSRTPSRCAATSARSRRSTAAASPTRSCR